MIELMVRLRKYAIRWRLSNFRQIEYKSITVNRLFTCTSVEHGECVIKVGYDIKDIENEYNILQNYEHTRFCKMYETDITNGILLLERIIPGIGLREEPCLDKRLELFCEIFNGLHIQAVDKSIYPTYIGWVSRITEYMRGRKDFEALTNKMIHAEQICLKLCEKYSDEMLLHGDLHHDNILLSENNYYRIIDPKGVIGDPVFDIPRFISNEFDGFASNKPGAMLDHDFNKKFIHIVRTFSEKFAIPKQDIRRLIYVEMCMAQCWNVESGHEPNMNYVQFVNKMLNERRV